MASVKEAAANTIAASRSPPLVFSSRATTTTGTSRILMTVRTLGTFSGTMPPLNANGKARGRPPPPPPAVATSLNPPDPPSLPHSSLTPGSSLSPQPEHHLPMRAMILEQPGQALRAAELPDPEPGDGQLLLRVSACGVCRTDLHLRDGEIAAPKLPVVLGHQIVARTDDGRRVGVPWLGWTDGECRYCTSGRENLCLHARFTGRDLDGGYAELTVADERFCLALPDGLSRSGRSPRCCAAA